MAAAVTKDISWVVKDGKITCPAKLKFPIGIVSSSSMEPTISRGDMVFLSSVTSGMYKTGDIVVYRTPKDGSLVIHRVIEIHSVEMYMNTTDWSSAYEDQLLMTKGDNNVGDDVELYGLDWLDRNLVVGKVRGVFPYIGYAWIALSD